MVPLLPTAHKVLLSAAATPLRSWVEPLFCVVQEAPPSVVTRTNPPAPANHAVVALATVKPLIWLKVPLDRFNENEFRVAVWFMASLKVTMTYELSPMPVALLAGLVGGTMMGFVVSGAAAVEKLDEKAADSAVPPEFCAALVTVTAYVALDRRLLVASKVMVVVAQENDPPLLVQRGVPPYT